MICVSIVEQEIEAALEALKEASRVAEMAEIRLDALKEPTVDPFLSSSEIPLLFTYRDPKEGGFSSTLLKERLFWLKEAAQKGAAWVDLELRAGKEAFSELQKVKADSRLLLSFHDFRGTPPLNELMNIVLEMKDSGADAGKVVTMVKKPEDNLTVLSLIPWAQKELGFPVIAFGMGEWGKISRVAAVFLGAPFVYASMPTGKKAAPGQLDALVLREILKYLQP